jgi:transposase
MSYSADLRECALNALAKGYTKDAVREMFGLGQHTLQDWEKLQKETGSLENRPLNRKPRKIGRQELIDYYAENPFALDTEAAEHFNCSAQGVRDACKAIGYTRKKKRNVTKSATNKSD